jgi:hypothetical protein
MKIRIVFKDPDQLRDAIAEAVNDQDAPEGLDEEEWLQVKIGRIDRLYEKATKTFFKWGEYLTVDWDTEDNTCVAVPHGERP